MKYVLVNDKQKVQVADLSIEDIFANHVSLERDQVPTVNQSIKKIVDGIIFNSSQIAFNKQKRDELYETISSKVVKNCEKYDHDINEAATELMKILVQKGML